MESLFLVEKELNGMSFYRSYFILVQIHLGQVMRSCERGDPGLIVVVNFFLDAWINVGCSHDLKNL